MNITLELTDQEVNMVLAGLGKLPFEQVVELVLKIKKQGEEQIFAAANPTQEKLD